MYERDNTEGMILLDGAAANATEETLLHTTTEANDGHFG